MIPKKNRADRKMIEKIFKTGKFLASPNLTFKFILNNSSLPRISFIVPKTVAKGAVLRNRLRRRGYVALGKYIGQFPPKIAGAFVFKKSNTPAKDIENEIKDILHKVN